MTTIIFSDTHLTARYNRQKFKFLEKIINSADRIIINGDFWDSYFCTFDEFLNSKWKKLFPLLKAKETIYLYGNHDTEKDNDARVNLFSNEQGLSYKFNYKTKKVMVEHGHRFDQTRLDLLPTFSRYKKFFRAVSWAAYYVELINTIFLKNWAHNLENMALKEQLLTTSNSYDINILSHTHFPEIDLENGYINTGFIKFGRGSYVVFGEKKIELVRRKY